MSDAVHHAATRHTNGTRPVTVGEIMSTALLTVATDESLLLAWEVVQRAGFHHLPVVDDDGHCVGLVERGDLAVACALPAAALTDRTVGDLLSEAEPPSAEADMTVEEAARVMTDHGLDALAVNGDDDTLEGLLTARDLVAVLAGRRVPRHGTADHGPVLFRMEPVLPTARG